MLAALSPYIILPDLFDLKDSPSSLGNIHSKTREVLFSRASDTLNPQFHFLIETSLQAQVKCFFKSEKARDQDSPWKQ